jgi:RNA polymerase sigma factor (sigma-70 family)
VRHLPITSKSAAGVRVPDTVARSPEILAEIKAYLECRTRGVEPSPPLAEAWEGFYRFYAPRIRTFLKRWALSEADRNDCVQEVWHEVVTQLVHFGHDPDRARLSTWLMTLARNKAVDVIRQRSRRTIVSLDDRTESAAMDPRPDPAAAYERRRMLTQLRSVLDELANQVSQTSFQALYLRWIEGRPTSEVAAVLALTPGQVRFRTHRMKRKLRHLMEKSLSADDGGGTDRLLRQNGLRLARNKRSHPASKE